MIDVWKPFRIGSLEIPSPVILAPLAGYSDLPFRMLCREMGCAYCTTEMMLDRLMTAKGRAQAFLLATTEDDAPLAGQLIGDEPAVMAEAAGVLCRLGFDAIDLNFACPVNKALKRRRGGWLMQHPRRIESIVRAVVEAADRPVTAKIRQKYAETDSAEAGMEVAARAFDAGADAVIAHARSVEAKYRGRADWAFLAELRRRHPDRTVMGSGDVLTPAAAVDMLRQTGVDAALAARGAVGNPWFFREVADLAAGRPVRRPGLAEQRQVLQRHFEEACALYGPLRGPRIMRKHAIKYARMHDHPKAMRMAFVDVASPDDFLAVLDRCY